MHVKVGYIFEQKKGENHWIADVTVNGHTCALACHLKYKGAHTYCISSNTRPSLI